MKIENTVNFKDGLKLKIKKLKLHNDNIKAYTYPWIERIQSSNLSKNDKKKKSKELIGITNFIYQLDKSIKLNEILIESPDAVLIKNNNLIGIELQDLIIQKKEKEIEGILEKIFQEIKNKFSSKNEKFKGVYRIEFFNESFSLKRKNKEIIIKEICFFIKNSHLENNTKFIKNIKKTPCKKIHIYRGEAVIIDSPLKKETVLENILSKEKNIKKYRKKRKFKELWLLLILGGLQKSSDYSYIDKSIKNDIFKSNFDRIFIYNFFEKEIISLKLNNTTSN